VVHCRGLLLRGASGAGKSDLALELLRRGHRLVADDVVEVAVRDGRPWGSGPAKIVGQLEIREVGMVEVRNLFGPEAVVAASPIHAVVDLLPPADTPPPRPVEPADSTPVAGVDIRTFPLHTTDTTTLANRLEVIARLVSNRGEEAAHG